jgi:hypothetical protein
MEIKPPEALTSDNPVGIFYVLPNGERVTAEEVNRMVKKVMEYNQENKVKTTKKPVKKDVPGQLDQLKLMQD